MEEEIKKYTDDGYIVFSIGLTQEVNKDNVWKKKIAFPSKWREIEKSCINIGKNGLAMETGKKNNIIVVDIDKPEDWEKLLNDYKQVDNFKNPRAKTANGYHLYFKYTDDLKEIPSNTKSFGNSYSIDIRSNGGCIILPPSSYMNNNTGKTSTYMWINSIFNARLTEMPQWMKDILLKIDGKKNIIEKKEAIETNLVNLETELEFSPNLQRKISKNKKVEVENENLNNIEPEDFDKHNNKDFNRKDIKILLDMLSFDRIDTYSTWIEVGMCLYNINNLYEFLWDEVSKKSNKYIEGDCEKKWKGFRKSNYKISSLLYWAKLDNEEKYKEFINSKKILDLVSQKYPDKRFTLGEVKNCNDNWQVWPIIDKNCFIKGDFHSDLENSMYLNIENNSMSIKCRHVECFGKTYPCNHIRLTHQELNIFNGNITININKSEEDLVEFQKIDIYENDEENYLVYMGLNGKSEQLAKLIYLNNKDNYMYAEDDNWYTFNGNFWSCTNKKCNGLVNLMYPTIERYYGKLIEYYKRNGNDCIKIQKIRYIIASVGDGNFKKTILNELGRLYDLKNKKKDFVNKLDSNQDLIGFNNGIYDLKKGEFRSGKADDYVSITVGYDYAGEKSDNYENLLKFLNDILPNKEELEYFLLYLSSGLYGNTLELYTILVGPGGRNGKSKLIQLIKLTFGKYFSSVASELFTRPCPDPSKPDPGLLHLLKKKIIIASEPGKKEKLHTGFLKFITGRDSKELRNCHSNEIIDFSPRFLTFLVCNDIPECDEMDNAFSKRLRCINFPTEFVSNPVNDRQRKIDININKNFEYWKMDFMLLLIEYYKKFLNAGEILPTKGILKWTNQYVEDTDIFLAFLNEMTEEAVTHIKCADLFHEFLLWFRKNNPSSKPCNIKDFNQGIKRYKKLEKIKFGKNSLLGIKYLQVRNDLE